MFSFFVLNKFDIVEFFNQLDFEMLNSMAFKHISIIILSGINPWQM